ncbi:hypothetical protein Salat_2530100 [Sesamum alatum]|uniref:Uncharacterized protein n=1 Tax=Sesamum alatum TaxID=300844 RepID=A0AAE1XSY4_9LAMI|nr:hypothetical protein Salat_2530100 [Sesamum alatum]
MSLQKRMGETEEEHKRAKQKLSVTEVEEDLVLDHQSNMNEEGEVMMELENMKKLLSDLRNELKYKDEKIDSLQTEVGKARQVELVSAEKDVYLEKLNEELRIAREKEQDMMVLLSENKRRIQELEAEAEREKQSESKMVESFEVRSKELEATKIELEKSRTIISTLRNRVESLEEMSRKSSRDIKCYSSEDDGSSRDVGIKSLILELQMTKENLAQAQECEKQALLKVTCLHDEAEALKMELNRALEADEKSTKALEDLALALKEVSTEANHAKEKMSFTIIELEQVKGEAELLKTMLRNTEESFQKLLNQARQEAELNRNTAERLRLEAEETVMAWNGKEMGFVGCIKRAEEERVITQSENCKLVESLKAAETMARAAREDTNRLRDILKQAVSEANAAKAAADIAREENYQLKDYLSEKDEQLHFLMEENIRLRISEAAAQEHVKEINRLLSTFSSELKTEDVDEDGILSSPDSDDQGDKMDNSEKNLSFNLEGLKFTTKPEDSVNKVLDEDLMKGGILKGSIFDTDAETLLSEPQTPIPVLPHQRRYSYAFTDDEGSTDSADFYHSDSALDEPDSDGNSNKRTKTMFQRVGSLMMARKSPSNRKTIVAQPLA